MNEQAILDAYNLFKQNGYGDSIDDFKKLIATNSSALKDSYDLFVKNGYGDSIDDYKSLMGLTIQTPKKKEGTESVSGLSSLVSATTPTRAVAESTAPKKVMLGLAPKKEEEGTSYLKNLYDNLALGASYVNEAVASVPETLINIFAIPQNYVAEKTGWNIGTNADQVKKQLGIRNPLLDWVQESQKVIKGDVSKYIAKNYDDPSIVGNFQKGNYQEGFELLGSSIAQSVPLSASIMMGGAYMAPARLAAITTVGLTEAQRKDLEEMDPNMKESEKTMKALAMSAAESVFESLGSATIGKVYRGIAEKEGKEAAKDILKNGLVQTYKKALEKTGAVAGFAGEGIEEAATQITQNVIAGRPTFEGVADAFATGAGSGVVFTAPISAAKAKSYIDTKVKTYRAKDKIGDVLGEKADQIDNLYNVPVNSEITPEQLEVANIDNSRLVLQRKLKTAVDKGDITEDDAKQSLYVFDKVQQVSNAVKDLDVSKEDKAKIATLLRQRDELKNKIQNQDDVLVTQQKQEIEDINNQIRDILSKPKEKVEIAIPEAISSLEDDEPVTFTVKTLEEIPEEFRDRAEKKEGMQVELRETILGLPIGKKTSMVVNDGYTYTLTGKEAKDYAIQKQTTGEVPVQPTSGISEEVEGGKPQPKPQVVTAEGIQETITPQVTEEKVKVQPVDFSKQLEDKYGVTVDLLGSLESDKPLSLSRIIVPEESRRQGIGSQVMRDIIDYADNNNKKLTLTPSTDFGGESVEVLTDFYKNFGFIENKGKSKDFTIKDTMYRIPEVSLKTPEVTLEQVSNIDTKDKTNLQKVYDFLDKADKDLEQFGKETAGMNLTVPVVRAIIKSLKALVSTGITLQEAIRRAAAENKVREEDVISAINLVSEQRMKEAKPQGVSEIELPGYNRMIGELEGVVQKSIERGNTQDVAMQNAIDYLQGSRVYQDASDTQREQMVRDVRKRFEKREKAAPKPEKLFGEAKDVNEITMSEYDLLKKQLKDTAKGAREAISARNKVSAALTKYLQQMVEGGYIRAKQMGSILNKFGRVNMFNNNSIEKFVDYMSKVFKNANYAEQISQVNAKLVNAKKNIRSKIGIAEGLAPQLTRLFAINPTLIPDAVFDKYVSLVNMMGERKAVLQLDEIGQVTQDVNDILNAVNEELSLVDELAERFDEYPNKLVDENGKIGFAETLKQMVEDGTITEQEAELMRKHKSSILPAEERVKRTEEEIEQERKELADTVKSAEINADELPTRDERDKARELQKLLNTDAVDSLDATQLKNLLKTIDNINNGYLTHYAELMVEKLNSINNGKAVANVVAKASPLKLSKLYASFKSLFTKKDATQELLRRTPLYYISQALGDFKTNNVFNALLEKAAEGYAKFSTELHRVENKLDRAMENVAKSFKNNPNKTLMSKFKMTSYLLQLEYASNPESKQVLPAIQFLDATIDQIESGKSSFTERDAEMLREIKKNFTDTNGEIDADALYNSFNQAEKDAIKTIQEVNNGLREKAAYTAAVLRGDNVALINNYVHHYASPDVSPNADIEGVSDISGYSNSRKASTKAKSLIERTGTATPINFDIFASAHRGAKYVLMDYYLTEPVRTARKTISEARNVLKETKQTDKEKRDLMNAIDFGFEEALNNILSDAFMTTSFADDVVNYISKQGYRALLASVPRFAAELTSNVGFAMVVAPKDFIRGSKMTDIVMSADAIDIVNNLNSKQTKRLFPKDTLSGKLVDTSIMNEIAGVRGGRAKSAVKNKMQQIYNNSGKKYLNAVETVADGLIATPDKLVMRPLWFGTFANEFQNLTGKEPDFSKIAQNDEAYMSENKEALEKAKLKADDISVLAGSTDNAFMAMLKGGKKTNVSSSIRMFNVFNNFMTKFLVQEYITARTGLYAAMGNGTISRKQGVALMGAVTTRMVLYTLLMQMLSNAMVGMFVDKEDDDDEKSFMQKLGQSFASGFTSLIFGRDFGNSTKTLINYGVEKMNENYLDFLRNGDYDPYKDAIQFSIMPPAQKGTKVEAFDLLANMMGPFGASAKTGELLIKKATEEPKKEEAAIQRAEKEKNIRIPLEVLGNLGMIPLYKDVRKVVNAQLYKDLDKREKKTEPVDKMNKEDMKKYFPKMYNELYGPGGTLYDVEQMKKEIRREKNKLDREVKDEMYRFSQ